MSLGPIDRLWGFFANIWGTLTFLALVIPAISLVQILLSALFPSLFGPLPSNLRVEILSQALAFFLSTADFLFIYTLRFNLWEYEWLRQVTRDKRMPSLVTMAVVAFQMSVVAALVYLILKLFWIPPASPPPVGLDVTGIVQKILLPILYSWIFVTFVFCTMLLCTVRYIRLLNQRVPQPVFMNTDHLVELVIASLRENLETENPLKVAEIERIPNGGVKLTVERLKEDGEEVEKKYDVIANERGRITSLKEQVTRRF